MQASKHPNLIAFAAGALATLALPPINILPLLFLSLGLLLAALLKTENKKQAFARGWWWGFGYFTFGLYWIAFALMVDIARFWWLVPLAVFALPAMMAIYIGFVGMAMQVVARRFQQKQLVMILSFPLFWLEFEIIRGTLFTGFPWNLIGTAYTDYPQLFQTASVFGIYGLGFLTAAMVSLWFLAAALPKWKMFLRAAPAAMLICMFVAGQLYLSAAQPASQTLAVRLVQPNIAQKEKWDAGRTEDHFATLLRLTASAAETPPALIVWPEAALPYNLATAPNARAAMADALPQGAVLATGSIRRDTQSNQVFNSIEYLDTRGEILGHYDKSHLVPFGEYVPFADYIPLPIVSAIGGLSAGDGPQSQTVGGLPSLSPLVCYEVIFPGKVTHGTPQLLLNVTNDGWYGKTAGPHQHLALARARAVEEGLPLIRAANTGISAVIDRHGRVVESQPYGKEGIVDAAVQIAPADAPRTPAANGGFWWWLGGLGLAWLILAIFIFRYNRQTFTHF